MLEKPFLSLDPDIVKSVETHRQAGTKPPPVIAKNMEERGWTLSYQPDSGRLNVTEKGALLASLQYNTETYKLKGIVPDTDVDDSLIDAYPHLKAAIKESRPE